MQLFCNVECNILYSFKMFTFMQDFNSDLYKIYISMQFL